MKERQPLIDLGTVGVGLVITAIGFFFKTVGRNLPPFFSEAGNTLFLLGALASLLLYGVYVWDWIDRNRTSLAARARFPHIRPQLGLLALCLLFVLLLALVLVLIRLIFLWEWYFSLRRSSCALHV